MTKLVPADSTQIDATEATEAERKAILSLVEEARKVSSSAKVRYVERERSESGVLLVVSLQTEGVDDSENFALYAIPHELGEIDGISLVVTQSSTPTHGNQLLKLRDFLSPETVSDDLREPVVLKNPLWRKSHERYKGVLFYGLPMSILTVLLMIYGYFPALEWAQKHYPQIFPGGTSKAFDRRIEAAKTDLKLYLRQINLQLEKKEELKLSDMQVQQLLRDKERLEESLRHLNGE